MINPHEEMLSEKFFENFWFIFSAQFAVINSCVIFVYLIERDSLSYSWALQMAAHGVKPGKSLVISLSCYKGLRKII